MRHSTFLAAALTALGLLAGSRAGAANAPTAAQAAPAPRAACSIHLCYEAPKAKLFYNEMTVEKSSRGSFFMACGFSDGYFGIQELSEGRKIVIFSVWDAAAGHNPQAVAKTDQVEVLYQAPDLQRVKRFGGEGTGVQTVYVHDWKEGEPCRFVLKVVEVDGKQAYAAYFYLPATKEWKHLATLRAPRNPDGLTGLFSFVEDFRRDFKSRDEVRRAVFSKGAVQDAQGVWHPLTRAQFTASESPLEARDAIDAGIEKNRFFLETGGATAMRTKPWTLLEKSGADKPFVPPTDLP